MTTEPRNGGTPRGAAEHDDALEKALAAYVDRLTAGERVDPLEVLAAHPGTGHLILERLESFVRPGGDADGDEDGPFPRRLGDHDLLRTLGRGGMGVVYEAWQHSLERRVALKLLPPGAAADRRAFARFVREAQAAGKLRHPSIVSVHGMGVEAGTPWYSMEYVEGKALARVIAQLRERLREGRIGAGSAGLAGILEGGDASLSFYARVARSFAEVADGLQHAHENGVIHRDIKPSNLILDAEGRLRILDFGLAQLEGREAISASGELVGTPLYMSPEQARRHKVPVDHRTDVYSLGATLYEVLVLAPPFRGRDYQETLSQIIEREPAAPRAADAGVPRDLETIVLKCLRKDPAGRYATAEALAQDLRRFARGQPIEARPQGAWEKALARIRRHRVKLVLAAAFLGLGLAFGWASYRWSAANAPGGPRPTAPPSSLR